MNQIIVAAGATGNLGGKIVQALHLSASRGALVPILKVRRVRLEWCFHYSKKYSTIIPYFHPTLPDGINTIRGEKMES